MAGFKGHITGGIITATITSSGVFYKTQNIKTTLIVAGLTIIFSLYPDMDIKSKSRFYLGILGLTILAILTYLNIDRVIIGYITLLMIIPGLSIHRGFAHSLLWLGIISIIGYHYSPYIALGISTGFFTHLLLDGHFKLI